MQTTEVPQQCNPCILSPSLCQKASPERLVSAFQVDGKSVESELYKVSGEENQLLGREIFTTQQKQH